MQGRHPVRLRRTGEGRRAAMREMRITRPLVAPKGAPRFHRRLAGREGRPTVANRTATGLQPHRNRTAPALEPQRIPD